VVSIPVALQLFTVRDLLKQDYAGTLKKAKDIGYDLVQLTGQMPCEAPGVKEMLDDAGLTVAGIHIGLSELEERVDYWADYAKTVGTKDVVVPYLPDELRRTKEDWLAMAARLDRLGAEYKSRGMRLSYHNHSFEFAQFDGVYGLELLYANSSPEHLYAEIDTYWVEHGGADPVEYVRKYSGRLPILHVKDMADDEERSFAEIGRGILDWEGILTAAAEAGTEVLAVEQDRCTGDPMESARISREFLKQLLG